MWTRCLIIILLILDTLMGCLGISLKSPRPWDFELLECTCYSSTKDIVDLEVHDIRVNRTHKALRGFIDVKVPLTDDLKMSLKILRSMSGNSNYQMTSMHVENVSLTKAMNSVYKQYFIPILKECSLNVYIYEGDFVAPFPVGLYDMQNCLPRKEDLPRYMLDGYYQIIIYSSQQAATFCNTLAKVVYDD